jgi:hypothetical protein
MGGEIWDIWSFLLTVSLAAVGWFLREKSQELHRIQILLNKTREEIARDYVTKEEMHTDIDRVLNRLEVLDGKLDRLMERRV